MAQKTSPSPVRVNPLVELGRLGQSVWLDFIQKSLIEKGELARLVAEDGLVGMTSNPAIFEKAIAGSKEYDLELGAAGKRCARDAQGVYEELAVADVRRAADALAPVYQRTAGRDGYVSLEVSPKLAHDTLGTIAEARRLWKAVARPNLMIKVPGTPAGVPAVRALIAEGLNVNVTLLFSLGAYRAVAAAYLDGLEDLVKRGGDPARVASVASFFVSRIDTAVDKLLAQKASGGASEAERRLAGALAGKSAIANAKLAYQAYLELIATARWQALAKKGARPQRLLWASTSTKDPKLPDTLYVDELIGADTVNTIPPATWAAFRDHGRAHVTLTEGLGEARETLALLWQLGISLERVTETLLAEGLTLFEQAFDKLLGAIAARAPGGAPRVLTGMSWSLPKPLASELAATLGEWDEEKKSARLWKKDATLWTSQDEGRWLGWLDIAAAEQQNLATYAALAAEVRAAGFTHALLLGMGGSSLCPEVLARTFGPQAGHPEFHVLDSTDPGQVASVERRVDLARTLVIVASKSGSTLEPNIFKQHFFARMQAAVGAAAAGKHFVAITDPGSKMQQVAEADGFRRVFFGLPSIGGRYSALSAFGLVPAAVMGLDVGRLLDRAQAMVAACGAGTKAADNPGVVLGLLLGLAARGGRDKLTIVTSRGVKALGAWLEQLIAESTGKQGKAIVPLDLEALATPERYGTDRVFVHLVQAGDDESEAVRALAVLEDAGHPVVRIELGDAYDLAREFFRWEVATAVAGAVLGIHPFDQPDVEASKVETRRLSEAYERTGALPAETPLFVGDGVELHADEANASALRAAVGATPSLAAYLRAHFARVRPGDYVPVLAYLEMNAAHEATLQELRHTLRDQLKVATCLGFGPRFLHSTGQAYKGGPNTAVVLQVTGDDGRDLPVPGQRYSFGVVKLAQARGDFAVLAERKRRALRVHLRGDVARGLATLERAVHEACVGTAKAQKRLAIVGLGRMGANMARRLMRAGHEVVGHARSRETVDALAREGARPAYSLAEAVAALPRPRLVWVMVPAGEATESTVNELAKHLERGDVVVDGGNSYFKDDVRRAKELAKKGIRFVDAGTSGGVWGLERGYCLMVGGEREAVAELEPILRALAPGRGTIERTRGRDGGRSSAEQGWLHCGPVGAGHFVKMIHNGIEYGMMQAYAEGFDVMKSAAKAEVPADWRYELELGEIAELWRRGSVVSSWLLDLTAIALAEDPELAGYTGFVQDSGEGRWTVQAAVEEAVPAEVLTSSLYTRFRSRQEHTFAEKLLSAMRKQFGGHAEPGK
jgi:transaldolase/glucose-6-phosphate isomerase